MNLVFILLAELFALLDILLPLLAAAVALRGLFWLLPIRIFWLQRILFHITEPAVRRIRNGFGIQAKSWDPAFVMTCSVLMILWATAVRSGLHLTLFLIL